MAWIAFQLQEVCDYDYESKYNLFPTIGTIMNNTLKENGDIEDILTRVLNFFTIYLHPKHIGELKFIGIEENNER